MTEEPLGGKPLGGGVFEGKVLWGKVEPDAQPTRARTTARRLYVAGFFGVVFTSAALFGARYSPAGSPLGSESALADAPFTAMSHEGDVRYKLGDVELSVHPKTLELIEWFDAHGLFRSVGFGTDGQVDRVVCEAVPAAGVTLPTASFRTAGIRFNERGEIIEILPASSNDDPCELRILIADPNPRNWIYTCVGPCPTPSACILGIDLPTLEIACACIP